MDLIGPPPKMKDGNKFIYVITDRYRELSEEMHKLKTTDFYIISLFMSHWVLPYRIPNILLTDNKPHFIAELF